MESNMRRRGSVPQKIRPSGGVEEDTVTHLEEMAGDQITGGPDLGMGYAWTQMTATEKVAKLLDLFARVPLYATTRDFQDAVIVEIDRRSAAVRWPTGADLAADCATWQGLSPIEKHNRVAHFFQAVSYLYATPADYDSTVSRIDDECVAALRTAGTSMPGRTTTLTGLDEGHRLTKIVVSLDYGSYELPSDLSVTLDGRAMTRVPPAFGGLFGASNSFEMSDLDAVPHTIAVTGSGIISAQQVVTAVFGHSTAVTFNLQPQPASIRVAIVVPAGASASSVTVAGVPGLSRAADGSWTASNVPPGTYDVVATAPDMVQQHQSITLSPGQAAPIGFALSYSPATVTVNVNVPNATVLLDGRPMTSTSPTAFTESVQPGDHPLSASAEGYVAAQQQVHLRGGQAASVTFTLLPSPAHVAPPHPVDDTSAPASPPGNGWKWIAALAVGVGGAVVYSRRKGVSTHDAAARRNPVGKTATQKFKVGDIVKYKASFLQSVGWYTDVPIDGRVEGISGSFVKVHWNDRDEPISVHPANITLAKKPDYSGL